MRGANPLRRPNATTRQAMADIRQGKKLTRFKTAKECVRAGSPMQNAVRVKP